MNKVDEKYYSGFEGEPEITFSLEEKNGDRREVEIWDGYFNQIMKQIKPEKEGWASLAYYYHLDIGWYDESPWLIENLVEAYEQLNKIDKNALEYKESKEVLDIILNMLREAIDSNCKVFISYD
jgi:hypothetical protein